jgi:hypothetical protein
VSITPNGHSMRIDYRGYHFCVVVPCINRLCFWPLIPVGGLRIYGKKEKGGVSVYHGVGWSCKPFVGVPCSAFTTTWWSCILTAYLRWPTLGLSILCNRDTLSAVDTAASLIAWALVVIRRPSLPVEQHQMRRKRNPASPRYLT